MFKYFPSIKNIMVKEKISASTYKNLYPDMELPKWMTSKENAVILFDDL